MRINTYQRKTLRSLQRIEHLLTSIGGTEAETKAKQEKLRSVIKALTDDPTEPKLDTQGETK